MAEEAFDLSVLDEVFEETEAQAEANSSFSNFGRLTYGPTLFKVFPDAGGVEEVSKEEWLSVGVTRQQMASHGIKGKIAEITVRVDIQEFKPELDFGYERRVGMGSVDWREHWSRSIANVFDIDEKVEGLRGAERQREFNKHVREAMKQIAGQYVEIADVPQEPRKNAPQTDVVYRTPELRQVFESREACMDEIQARFGTAPQVSEREAPEGFDSWQEFVKTVGIMRNNGGSNAEIANNLGVPVAAVAQV